MRQLYLRSLVILGTLLCYYLGVTVVQVPQGMQWTIFVLVFVGYVALGFIFGFLLDGSIRGVGLAFVLGVIGAMLSIVVYRVLVSQYALSQISQDLVGIFAASFFVGIAVAAGACVNTLLVWIFRQRSGRRKSQSKRRSNEDRPQSAELA